MAGHSILGLALTITTGRRQTDCSFSRSDLKIMYRALSGMSRIMPEFRLVDTPLRENAEIRVE